MGEQVGDHEEQLAEHEHAYAEDRAGVDAADGDQEAEARAEVRVEVLGDVHPRAGEESLLHVEARRQH